MKDLVRVASNRNSFEATLKSGVREVIVWTDMAPNVTGEIESVLQEWRTKALNVLLTVAAVLGLPAVLSILLYVDPGQDWRLPFLSLLVTYLLLVGLAVFRRLNIQLRGWGLLLVGYMAAILTLMQGGLAGTGQTFLMVLPVLAITLIGVRSGLIAAALSLVVFTVFAIFAHLGWWGMLPQDTAFPAEALDWIRQGDPFDVAILDMQMPEMDGLKLAAEIRRERDTDALPLVMLTSLGQQEAGREEGVEFAAFLTKPVKASQLYNVLVGVFAEDARPTQQPEGLLRSQFDPEMGQRLPLRILLTEDNVVNQKLALRLLERMGYRADLASNGLEAIAALRRQSYDVVLMDVQMPEMDGLEATRTLCQEWSHERRPRIIAMTASAMQEDREACLAAGMDDYVSKPIQVEELVRALSQCRSPE